MQKHPPGILASALRWFSEDILFKIIPNTEYLTHKLINRPFGEEFAERMATTELSSLDFKAIYLPSRLEPHSGFSSIHTDSTRID
jgi:hypothetical protein